MTEQQAEAFAARLTRIWEVDANGLTSVELKPGAFRFTGQLTVGIRFVCWRETSTFLYAIGAPDGRGGLEYSELGIDKLSFSSEPESTHFASRWLDFFRRSCWLSGLPVEASAHEKAEWLQGFTHEEIQAWNLKI